MARQKKNIKTEVLALRISPQEKAMIRRMSAQYGWGGMSKAVRKLILQEAARLEMAQRVEGGCNG